MAASTPRSLIWAFLCALLYSVTVHSAVIGSGDALITHVYTTVNLPVGTLTPRSLVPTVVQPLPASITAPPQLFLSGSAVCPEDCGFGNWACDSPWCNGLNPYHTCDKGFGAEDLPPCTCTTSGGYSAIGEAGAGSCVLGHPHTDATESPDRRFTTLTVTQNDGVTVTAEYSIIKHTEYASLKDALVIESAITGTDADGATYTETETKTVEPSGNELIFIPPIWIPIVGIPPPIVLPPVIPPEVLEDELDEEKDNCPADPKPKCSGETCAPLKTDSDSMCTAGPHEFCPCEADKCPEEELICEKCGSTEEKCKTGDYKDCPCTNEKCPEGEYSLRCDQCGGTGENWYTCAGKQGDDEELVGRWKGCECSTFDSPPPHPGPSDKELAEIRWAFSHARPWEDNWDLDAMRPVCHTSDVVAHQQPKDDAQYNVVTAINNFCSAWNRRRLVKPASVQDVLTYGKDIIYVSSPADANKPNDQFWISAMYPTTAVDGFDCGGDVTLTEKECVRVLNHAMVTCDPDGSVTHGAYYHALCIDYYIQTDSDAKKHPMSPPWKRLPDNATVGACNATDFARGARSVETAWFKHIFPAFCRDWNDEANVTIGYEKSYGREVYRSLAASSPDADAAPAGADTPPSGPGSYPDEAGYPWRFSFRWDPNTDDEQIPWYFTECQDAFARLTAGHCGTQGISGPYQMSNTGFLDAGSGVWSYLISPPEPNESQCLVNDNECYPAACSPRSPYYFSWQADQAIRWFCDGAQASGGASGDTDKIMVDPDTDHTPAGNPHLIVEPSYPERMYYFRTNNIIMHLYAAFADVARKETIYGTNEIPTSAACNPNPAKAFMMTSEAEQCKEVLRTGLRNCNDLRAGGAWADYYDGARVIQHGAAYGCVVWTIKAYQPAGDIPQCARDNSCWVVQPDGASLTLGLEGMRAWAELEGRTMQDLLRSLQEEGAEAEGE